MSQELLYTSAPKGLKSGSRGFCTVLCTRGMPAPLTAALESLSGYRHVFPPGSQEASKNPVNFAHTIMKVAGRPHHILTRVSDYGLDYSNRSNKIAHHLVPESSELGDSGPAAYLQSHEVVRNSWDGKTALMSPRNLGHIDGRSSTSCEAWKNATGDAGWGGVLAESFLSAPDQTVYIIYDAETDVLSLLEESISLLPTEKRWGVTFSTYFTGVPQTVSCLWRCILKGSPEEESSKRFVRALRIDLTQKLETAKGGPLVEAARTGNQRPLQTFKSAVSAPQINKDPDVEFEALEPASLQETGRTIPVATGSVKPPPRRRSELWTDKRDQHSGRRSSRKKFVITGLMYLLLPIVAVIGLGYFAFVRLQKPSQSVAQLDNQEDQSQVDKEKNPKNDSGISGKDSEGSRTASSTQDDENKSKATNNAMPDYKASPLNPTGNEDTPDNPEPKKTPDEQKTKPPTKTSSSIREATETVDESQDNQPAVKIEYIDIESKDERNIKLTDFDEPRNLKLTLLERSGESFSTSGGRLVATYATFGKPFAEFTIARDEIRLKLNYKKEVPSYSDNIDRLKSSILEIVDEKKKLLRYYVLRKPIALENYSFATEYKWGWELATENFLLTQGEIKKLEKRIAATATAIEEKYPFYNKVDLRGIDSIQFKHKDKYYTMKVVNHDGDVFRLDNNLAPEFITDLIADFDNVARFSGAAKNAGNDLTKKHSFEVTEKKSKRYVLAIEFDTPKLMGDKIDVLLKDINNKIDKVEAIKDLEITLNILEGKDSRASKEYKEIVRFLENSDSGKKGPISADEFREGWKMMEAASQSLARFKEEAKDLQVSGFTAYRELRVDDLVKKAEDKIEQINQELDQSTPEDYDELKAELKAELKVAQDNLELAKFRREQVDRHNNNSVLRIDIFEPAIPASGP